ncbi:hypothetical protein PGTUg99_015839 [Puccinia graminis f. sp. tritici]|uniref:T6SS Phospholipase effector Tle1-like catalytic domain-containing protein n=1 Tax=Puccinia graminis f. sp. tritici TaxID=56615 RepID=A0A5B0M2G4_PUCGR|nr:hypothetical protein PGTUg99_015839 [Puccinia graminis f. sp. tritici]
MTSIKKRLIVCCDGSWDDGHDDRTTDADQSNVSKLARCISPEDRQTFPNPTPQIVFYQSGQEYGLALQGTPGTSFLVNQIRDAYAFLVQHYIPGDELLLFGFSRGAFIARTIAEMVAEIGILNMAGMEDFYQVLAACQLLHAKGDSDRVELGRASAQAFLDEYYQGGQKQLRRISEGSLKCVGVWDMVGACGLPGPFAQKYPLLGFGDRKLSVHIKYAFHAIAMSETRTDLQPTKWELESTSKECNEPEQKQVLKQVWFPCSHIEAGGQIEEYDDVTYISLLWMAANLIHHNLLAINEEYLHGMLSVFWTRVQRGFGLYDPEGPRRYCLSSTTRQIPKSLNALTKETIHRSAFSSPERIILGLEQVQTDYKAEPELLEELLPFEIEIRNHLDFLTKQWAVHEGHRVRPDEFNDWPDQQSWNQERWYLNFKETQLGSKPQTHGLFLDLMDQSFWPLDTRRLKEEMISRGRGRGHASVEDAAMRMLGTPMD